MNLSRSVPERQAIEQLRQGSVLIAASARLAAQWKQRFVESCGGVVETPAIHTWQEWLNALALRWPDLPIPLSSLQEQQLWERVIVADRSAGDDNASARGLARHASEAYGLLREYRINARELAGASEEADALARWITAMRRTLNQEQRSLAADLPELLLPLIAPNVTDSSVLLDGFDRFTPMQQALLQALNESGVELASVEARSGAAGMTVTACADIEAEHRYVARQIAEAIETDAHARIAVVTGRQESDAETLRRILNETLLTRAEASAMQAVTMPGASLATAPLIRQLLDLLHLAGRSGVPFSDLSPLLFSPGVKGFAEERWVRARLDAKLREDNRHYLTFGSLLAMDEVKGMPQLAGVIQGLLDWDTGAYTAGEWVKAVHGLLQGAGFLQAEVAGRSGSEIRQLNAFRECLASLVAVDAVYERMAWGDFLSLLASVCNEMRLSGPVRFPQVSVLPLEQIAGLRFDSVFAVGFDEEALPLPTQPAPLLPFSLQRKHGLPGATAALAFSESAFLWQQLKQAAPVVRVSFAHSREERELNASPLLAGITIESCDVVTENPSPLEREVFDDAPVVPLSADERVQGGSAIIKSQSACPFRAFAAHRLNLAPLGETVPGVTPADKGSLIHRALQFIWERLGSQRVLLTLDDTEAASLIDEAVAHAWREARVTVAESTRKFERRRMVAVLSEWLEEERKRPPFSVECCEKPYRLELPASGAIHFPVKLKADRIDRDEEGHKILIDYKTGRKQSIGKWIGERPAEPQLPLYAVAEGLGVDDAVCFARVRSGDMGFEGLGGEATGIRGVSVYKGNDEAAEDWPALLSCWRERIDALAVEFVEGRCEVMPQDAKACDYCGLEAVCRIDEIGIDRDEDGEDTA